MIKRLASLLAIFTGAESKICRLHQCDLQEGAVEVKYGLRRLKDAYRKAKKEQFPNSNLEAFGGCYFSESFPKTATVRYCEQCRVAERAWLARSHSD
jgi:hypothetical protein